jgi:hypothetical protein
MEITIHENIGEQENGIKNETSSETPSNAQSDSIYENDVVVVSEKSFTDSIVVG